MTQLKTQVMRVSPKQATAWLEQRDGVGNRTPLVSMITRYARDMDQGRWALNGDSIKLDATGHLLDGQNRLMACIQAGKPFTSLVVIGVDRSAFDTMDTGRSRTLSDVLSAKGISDARDIAALCRAVWLYERNGTPFRGGENSNSTVREIEQTWEAHPELAASVPMARRLQPLMPRSVGGFSHWVFSRSDATLADAFCDSVVTGESLRPREPAYILRERLISNRGARAKLPKHVLAAMTIKAWNATKSGKSVGLLKFLPDEEFPSVL